MGAETSEPPWVKVSPLNGLDESWANRRVWCNPPYSRGDLSAAVAKMASEREQAQIIVALLPVATATKWWRVSVQPHADVIFLPRRVRFLGDDGKPVGSPRFDSCIAVFRSTPEW